MKERDPSLQSGLYQINGSAAGIENLVVYCDMETDGGNLSFNWNMRIL